MVEQEKNLEQVQQLNELEKIKNILSNNPMFLLVSVTFVIDGRRKFIDLPILTTEGSMPHRNDLFLYSMDVQKVESTEQEYFNKILETFAIISIYEFKNQQQYECYVGSELLREHNESNDDIKDE